MKRYDFTNFEEFAQHVNTQRENGADGYEEITVVRENGWFKADLMTCTKSAKVAINRFFRVLPELASWKEFLVEAISCGCWKDNDFTMACGSRNDNPSFAWEVDASNEDMVYIFLNVHEATHIA